jgi:hypothetical protein
MFGAVISMLISAINTVYYFLADNLGLRFLDNPGTYIFIMVIGFAMVPFYAKEIYAIYINPHIYERVSLTMKILKALITIGAIVFFGYANFTRFLPPAV